MSQLELAHDCWLIGRLGIVRSGVCGLGALYAALGHGASAATAVVRLQCAAQVGLVVVTPEVLRCDSSGSQLESVVTAKRIKHLPPSDTGTSEQEWSGD